MKRILAFFMICCAAAFLLSPAALAAPEEEPAFDGYLIRMDDAPEEDDTPDGCEEIADGLYHAETAEDALALAELGSVEYCEPNYSRTIQDNYDDYEPAQWNLLSVGAEAGWAHRDASGSRDRLVRARELLERSRQLIAQNDDPEVSDLTICGELALA